MAKRKVMRGKRGYKKCLMSKMKRTKFTTPKAAARAFRMAKKKCRVLLAKKPRRHGRKKRHGRKRRHGRVATNGRKAAALRRSLARLGRAPGEWGAMAGRIPARYR